MDDAQERHFHLTNGGKFTRRVCSPIESAEPPRSDMISLAALCGGQLQVNGHRHHIFALRPPGCTIKGYTGPLDGEFLPDHLLSRTPSNRKHLSKKLAMAIDRSPPAPPPSGPYSVTRGALKALQALIEACGLNIPDDFLRYVEYIGFTAAQPGSDMVHFPTPLREQDAMLAIKALEACAVAAIADLRYGGDGRQIAVDIDKTSCFLMSAYLTTVDGMGKQDPEVKKKIPGESKRKHTSAYPSILTIDRYGPKPGSVDPVPSTLCQSV